MRRVYYTFGIRVATHATTMHLAVLVGSVYALGYFVHVAAVYRNVTSIPLSDAAGYLANAVLHTEGITMVVLGAVTLAALSLPMSLPRFKQQGMQAV